MFRLSRCVTVVFNLNLYSILFSIFLRIIDLLFFIVVEEAPDDF